MKTLQAFTLIFLTSITGFSQNVKLLKDINTVANTNLYDAGNSIVYKGYLYFTMKNVEFGSELWKTDGTQNGTSLVKDIIPGAIGPFDYNKPLFTIYNNLLFFNANTDEFGAELWRTDGTSSGTLLVKDINPGSGTGLYSGATAISNGVVFVGNDSSGVGLWISDGTAAGTHRIFTMPGNAGVNEKFSSFYALNNQVLFFGNNGTDGIELWRSDGTTGGTYMVKDICTGTSGLYPGYAIYPTSLPVNFTTLNGIAYFFADDFTNGVELWRTDGTMGGTSLVKDFSPGSGGSSKSNFALINIDSTRFMCLAYDPTVDYEIRISDGTPNGSVLLKDIYLNGGQPYWSGFTVSKNSINQLHFGSNTYFKAADATTGTELWVTDGTTNGTHIVKDMYPGTVAGVQEIFDSLATGMIFSSKDSTGSISLYLTQGTDSTTLKLKTFTNVIYNGQVYIPYLGFMGKINGKIIFTESSNLDYRSRLWSTDGTSSNTVNFYIPEPSTQSSSPINFFKYNNEWFFTANNGLGDYQIWKTDGTVGGTYPFTSKTGKNFRSFSSSFFTLGGSLFFLGADSSHSGFWKYTSGPSSSIQFRDYGNGVLPYSGTKVMFSGYNNVIGSEPFLFNGTTSVLSEINTANNCNTNNVQYCGSSPSFIRKVPSGALFSAKESDGVYDLWTFDGSGIGQIKELMDYATSYLYTDSAYYFFIENKKIGYDNYNSGRSYTLTGNGYDSAFCTLAATNTEVYFAAKSGTSNYQLYKYKVIDNFATLVKVVNQSGSAFDYSSASSSKKRAAVLNNKCVFYGDDGINGFEPWISDGTSSGTQLLKNINSAGDSKAKGNTSFFSNGEVFIAYNNKLYFIGDDGVHGKELWVTDGTTSGTNMVADINPSGDAFISSTLYSSSLSSYQPITTTDSTWFFTLSTGTGKDIFYLDKQSGSLLHFDVCPGYSDVMSTGFQTIPEINVLAAFTPKYGYELYNYSLNNPPNPNLVCNVSSSCKGDSLSLYYSVPYNVNRGNLNTLQLSDANGSFSNPTIIRNLPIYYDRVTIPIPASVPPGNHYRFRIVTTVPTQTLPDNGIDIVISEKPHITNCVDSIVVNAMPTQCGAYVNYNFSAIGFPQGESDYSRASGSFFAKGITQVFFTAWNGCGYDTCWFNVVVKDSESPVISCPSDIVTTDTIVTYSPSATDNCDNPVVTISPPTGSTFPVGSSTYVTVSATDMSGNTDTCGFMVTVNPLRLIGDQKNELIVNNVLVSPVPANEKVIISFNMNTEEIVFVQVRNFLGTLVKEYVIKSHSGNNFLNMDTRALPSGVYILDIQSQKKITSSKIIIGHP